MFDVFRGSHKGLDKNIVFRSLRPRDSNPVSSPTARPDSRLKVLINWWVLCAAQQLRVVVILFADHRDHVINSSYVNNTMSPNIEVEYSKPVKGNMALLSRHTLITLTSITIVSHTYAEGQTHLR